MTALARLTVEVPENEWLSANDRRHWADKAARTAALRGRARLLARAAKLDPYTGPVLIWALVKYPTARRADPPNTYPTVKALIDGLVDAGIFPDDDSDHVNLGFGRAAGKSRRGTYEIELILTDQTVPF